MLQNEVISMEGEDKEPGRTSRTKPHYGMPIT